MKKTNILFNVVLLPVDILMILVSFAFAYYLRSQFDVVYVWPFADYLKFVLIFLPIWVAIFTVEGLYNIRNPKKGLNEFYSVIVAVSASIAAMVIWLFLSRTTFFSRLVIAYSWIFAIVFISMGRFIVKQVQIALFKNNIGILKLVIVGNNKIAYDLVKTIQNDKSYGYKFAGVVSTAEDNIKKSKNNKILGDIDKISSIYSQTKFDVLVLANSKISQQKSNFIADFCDDKNIIFKEIPNLFQVKSSNAIYSTIGGIPMINFRRTPLEGWGSVLKRIFDIIVSILFIVISSPIMLITAIAIKLDSKGPVFFAYKRIGRYGKPFTYFKFRSMVEDAHKIRYSKEFRQKAKDMGGWNKDNPLIKFKDDPRITSVGKFIRKYSIDELPEFILVLLGRMSMVGPRPHEREEVAKYKKHHKKVLAIKPGITGMAQVSGRSDLTFEDEVRLDTYYIENWSIWQDLKIVFKTPIAILRKREKL